MTINAAQIIAQEYGPRSIRHNSECGLAIAPSFGALQQSVGRIPKDYETVILVNDTDFGVARGAIMGRKSVILCDGGDKAWRADVESFLKGINANIEPAPVEAILVRGDTVTPEPIRWLWNGYLARGKLHILAGQAGQGKTTIALSLAATLTRGGTWPDGPPAKPSSVIIWSGEDDPADTLAPRLQAMGADMARIHFVTGVHDGDGQRVFDPALDIEALANAVQRIRPDLLIVDPIVSAVAGDSHKNGETRRALQPLVDTAAAYDMAVFGISHFSKGSSGRNPTERVTGSLAFGALARIVLAAAKVEEEQGGGRIFCRTKSNIGGDDGGFRYDLEQRPVPDCPSIMASCVVWGDAIEGQARELLNKAEAIDGESGSLAAAKEFLVVELDDGPKPVKAIQTVAEDAGHKWRTIQRAKDALGIVADKDGMKGGWFWVLPPKSAKDAEECQQKGLASFGNVGVLQDNPGQGWEAEL